MVSLECPTRTLRIQLVLDSCHWQAQKETLPNVLHRFPPDHPLRWNQSNSDSKTDEEICIPQNADADVCFNILDGVPGLQVTTKNSSKWTPIASGTHNSCHLHSTPMPKLI